MGYWRYWASTAGWLAFCAVGAEARQGELLHVFTGEGSAGRGLGQVVAPAGDVDGDGFDDLIVGYRTGVGGGTAQVFSGADGSVLHTFTGLAAGDLFGRAVAGAGDVNGDGFDDLIVGAAGEDANGVDSGAAYVFSGKNGSLLHKFVGDFPRARLGGAVGGAGDLNGDGFDDLIVGGQPDSGTPQPRGFARVYSGADGSLLHEFIGPTSLSRLGCSVASAGDVNGDGVPDILIGDWRDGTGGGNAGSASVFSGADGSLLLRVHGTRSEDRLGTVVAALGDLDGDGRPDFLAGSPWANGAQPAVGLVRVFSGAEGTVLYSIHGDAMHDFFGASAAGVGDFDGDGVPDFAVGAYGDDDGGLNAGSVRVYSGADGSVILRVDGDSAADELGYSVSAAGNMSGRGSHDLAIGAPNDNQGGGPGSGAVFVLAGAVPAEDDDGEDDGEDEGGVERYCTPGPNAFGDGATLGYAGSRSAAARDFTLTVEGARPRGVGFFFFGHERQEQPFMKGVLCVGRPRHALGHALHLDRHGSARISLAEICRPWIRDRFAAGSTWNFQFLYIDPPARHTGPFNLSDALGVTFAP